MEPPKRVFSGIQPTAVMTIGNYFGAVKNWVRLQDECDAVYCVVDLHAMTVAYDPRELRRATKEMFVALLACGVDPERATVFVQSTAPEHTELCWVFATLASLGDLGRMTQFKEKSNLLKGRSSSGAGPGGESAADGGLGGKSATGGGLGNQSAAGGGLGSQDDEVANDGITDDRTTDDGTFVPSGLLFYPVLQAADILAYRADFVPVGRDQSQHLELSRGLARRFNARFGQVFPEPETLHTPVPKLVSTADPTKKMSKSLGPRHYIGLFEEEDSVRRKVRSAVTDSGAPPSSDEASPGIENLLTILTACGFEADAQQMRRDYFAGSLRYVDLKGRTADALVALTTEMRDRRADVLRREKDLDGLIHAMAGRARAMAGATLALVREKTGLYPPGRPQGVVPIP